MLVRFGQWCYYDEAKLNITPSVSNSSVKIKLHADLLSFDMAMETKNYNNVAKSIKEERVAKMVHLHGRSNNPGAAIAKTLSLQASDKSKKMPATSFMITEVTHYVQDNGKYSNIFTAIPKSAAKPPAAIIMPQFAKPRVPS